MSRLNKRLIEIHYECKKGLDGVKRLFKWFLLRWRGRWDEVPVPPSLNKERLNPLLIAKNEY